MRYLFLFFAILVLPLSLRAQTPYSGMTRMELELFLKHAKACTSLKRSLDTVYTGVEILDYDDVTLEASFDTKNRLLDFNYTTVSSYDSDAVQEFEHLVQTLVREIGKPDTVIYRPKYYYLEYQWFSPYGNRSVVSSVGVVTYNESVTDAKEYIAETRYPEVNYYGGSQLLASVNAEVFKPLRLGALRTEIRKHFTLIESGFMGDTNREYDLYSTKSPFRGMECRDVFAEFRNDRLYAFYVRSPNNYPDSRIQTEELIERCKSAYGMYSMRNRSATSESAEWYFKDRHITILYNHADERFFYSEEPPYKNDPPKRNK